MSVERELTERPNVRRGPGWWMDGDGAWRSPGEWPEDSPPLPGWIRDPSGGWMAPDEPSDTRWTRHDEAFPDPDPAEERAMSRRARADRRAMLVVSGMIVGGLLLLATALFLITQAGATGDDADVGDAPVTTGVIYAAETDADLAARRQAVAATMPARTEVLLAELGATARPADAPAYDAADWPSATEGCLSLDEQVLIARSASDVEYVDDMECVVDRGRWVDRVHSQVLTSAVDAEVVSFVPLPQVWAAGGWNWTDDTKQAFMSDLAHPAVHQIVARGFGHNPRQQSPVDWKPASRASWCAYAVDWIEVKHRWNLGVTDAERAELQAMLDSCAEADSTGADPLTVTLDPLASPEISLLSG